jgi:putative ABC transport system substrate-binding protein
MHPLILMSDAANGATTMGTAIRRLSLGLVLILLVSGILLVSDWNHGNMAKHKMPQVALFKFQSQPLVDEGVGGVIEGLKARGFIPGQTIRIDEFNAQNDFPTANSIGRAIAEGGYDLAITVTTPCLQALASANRAGKVMHVFGLVTDPFIAGVGLNRDKPLEHPRHLVGIGTFDPVRNALLDAKRSYPALRRVGTVWNPAEACSQACMQVARSTCKEMGVELLEAEAENSTAVGVAASSLLARGVEAIFIGGDNTVEIAMNVIVKLANEGHIPVITTVPGHADEGALIGLGADYVEVGRAEGQLAADILSGRDPATVPIINLSPNKLALNLSVLRRLQAKWEIPPEILESAAIVINERGQRTEKARTPPAGPQPAAALPKK